MQDKPRKAYWMKRSRIATILLIIELAAIILLFAFLHNALRTKYSDLALENLSGNIVGNISSSIWRKVTLIAQNGDELLAGNISGNMSNHLASPISFSLKSPILNHRMKLKLSGSDRHTLYISSLENGNDQGMILPFAITSNTDREKTVSGYVKIPGILDYLNGLAERDVFCKIQTMSEGAVLLDTSVDTAHLRLDRMSNEFKSWEKAIREFNVLVAVTAPMSFLETPVIPQVLLVLGFLLISSLVVFIHVRIIKPASMSVDLFQEKREDLGIELPTAHLKDNLFLNVDSLIGAHSKLEESYNHVKGKLEKVEFGSLIELRNKHEELLIHHNITKKMLKALNKDSVISILIEGVKEFGYNNFLWGAFNREKMGIDFDLDVLQYGKEKVRIPLLDDTFFLTKVSWSGVYHFVDDPNKIDCRYDDLILISGGPAFIIPVLKNRRFKCYQHYKCNMADCPAYMSGDPKCWARGIVKCELHMLEPANNPKENCFNCRLFNVEGVLIVKEEKKGKKLQSESISNIVGLVNEASLALEIAGMYEESERLSITDSLTGLYNHGEFFKLLRSELDRSKRFDTHLSLLMIDVDNFKVFNDTFGHLAGDVALKLISGAIKRAVRKIDIVSRYGGEEFTAILPETDQGGAIVLAERIKREVASMNMSPVEDERVNLTVSIGICSCQEGNMTPDQLVSRADDASYLAKKMGKNKICVSDRI
jgi:diguanylate cyclase (GGDEF)-like protein